LSEQSYYEWKLDLKAAKKELQEAKDKVHDIERRISGILKYMDDYERNLLSKRQT
jgi:hypothetical protein